MAINIKFDLAGNPEPPTIILATRSGNKLGQLDVNPESIELIDKLNDASEFSFTLNKYVDGKIVNLWDRVVDFKLVYCKEWDMWFEITVELDEDTETVKTVTCTQLGQAELSQIMLYNIEINTEKDIERDDYKITILWNADDHEASILHRLLKDKAPHYSVIHVDPTIARIQRSFSFDGTSIYDAFQEIAEEIGCLFVFDSNSDEDGKIQRTISVYDLQQNCNNTACRHRGEFTGICPKCGSTDIEYGYGEDTRIFVTSDELAASGIQLTTDTDAVKNCFKLEAGDDLMTATIRNCNPNGTDYIWRFSDDMKEDMSSELVERIESYDTRYKTYHIEHDTNLDTVLLNDYNNLVNKYRVYNEELQQIMNPIKGYSSLMNAYYNTIDLDLYLKSALMPSVKTSKTDAEEQASLLTQSSLSPVAVTNINTVSLPTANSAVLAMAKVIVKPTYKVQVNNSELVGKTWTGNFVVTNYSDEEDTAFSPVVSILITGDMEEFIKQKLEKELNKENADDLSITGLFEKEILLDVIADNEKKYETIHRIDENGNCECPFCAELKKYALNPLISFREACQSCIDILIKQEIGSDTTSDLYKNIYDPYYKKLMSIEAEIALREQEISIVSGVYDLDGNLVSEGLQQNIGRYRDQIQDELNFQKYLEKENLWLEFCSYRREDKYSNDNYISDGLDNAELFKKALEFYEVAENEIFKASELQHSISTTLNNLLAIPKFKSLVNSFKVGNWIRIQIDDRIYKLRLLEYDIDYGGFDKISVEFSDVTKIKNGTTDVQDILSKASSMATSYDSIQRQAIKGNNAQSTITQWVKDGLNTAHVRIQSNDNEDIQMTKNGLLCRTFDDVTGTWSPEQLKLTHNIMAYTDDDWATVKQAIGKHDYKYYDEYEKKIADNVGYGMTADFVTAAYISGSQIIGGDIYSDNYSGTEGSHLDLTNGEFSFAGGKLKYDGTYLTVDGKITVAEEGTIGCWEVCKDSIFRGSDSWGDKDGMYFGTNGLSIKNVFKVDSNGNATVKGTLTAGSGSSIGGWTASDSALYTTGNALYLGTSGTTANIGGASRSNLVFKAGSNFGVDSSGNLYATGGTIGGCTIDSSGKLIVPAANITDLTLGALGSISFENISDGTEQVTNITKSTVTTSYVNALNITASSISADDVTAGELNANVITLGNIHGGFCSAEGTSVDEDGEEFATYGAKMYGQYPDKNYIIVTGYGTRIQGAETSFYVADKVIGASQNIAVGSDRRLKQDITYDVEKYRSFFRDLKPSAFHYIKKPNDPMVCGFIAQDVEDALIKNGLSRNDFCGLYGGVLDEKTGELSTYSIAYEQFIPLLTDAVHDLYERLERIESKLDV